MSYLSFTLVGFSGRYGRFDPAHCVTKAAVAALPLSSPPL
jgi:hypothetical protein